MPTTTTSVLNEPVHARATWLDAESAYGPATAEWLSKVLVDRGECTSMYGDSFTRSLYAWVIEERNISFYTLDAWLNKLGIHPSEAPEHIWRPEKAKVPDKLVRAMRLFPSDGLEMVGSVSPALRRSA